jgi:hypothetical protein
MATAREFTTAESYLGRVTEETRDRYPGFDLGPTPTLSFLTAQKGARASGQDPTNPATLRGIAQSTGHASQLKTLATTGDRRTLERIAGLKGFDLAPLDSPASELIESGFQGQILASRIKMRGRQAAFRHIMDQQNKLQEFSGMESDIRRKENKLRLQATDPIDRQIKATQNQMFSARSILASQITHLSPSQQNAVLASQRHFFQSRINNFESIRKSRLNAIDEQSDREEADLQRSIDRSNTIISGYQRAIEFAENTASDRTGLAELYIKLGQERKKQKKGQMPSAQAVLFEQAKEQRRNDKQAEGLDPTLTAREEREELENAKRTYEARQSFEPGEKPTGRDLTFEDVEQFTPPKLQRLPVKQQTYTSINIEREAEGVYKQAIAQDVWDGVKTAAETGMSIREAGGILNMSKKKIEKKEKAQ